MRIRGFTQVARMLSDHYGKEVSRQQVYQWWKRETANAAGQPFPREVWTDPDAPHGRPARDFELSAVLGWAEAGVPDTYGNGYRLLSVRPLPRSQASQPGGN